MTSGWLADAARTPVREAAARRGIEVRHAPSADHCRGPCCGAERRHPSRRDRRGAVGIPHSRPTTWHCHACGASGDAVDFIAYDLCGARFRDLSTERKAEVRAWFGHGIVTAPNRVRRIQPPVEPKYPPTNEMLAIWRACGGICA